MNKIYLIISIIFVFLSGCVSVSSDKNDDTVAESDAGEDTNLETVDDDDDSAVNSDSGDDDSASNSNTEPMHGGSPAPVTWTDCNQWPGSHPCDFSLLDQNGDTFTLYDNYNTVMVLDFSTMWCSVCKSIASDAQTYQDTYGSQGFLWITVLVEDTDGNAPDQSDLEDWVATYGITSSPVLAGNRADFVDLSGETGYPITGWPTLVVIDRGMVLYNGINGWNEEVVLSWIEDNL